MSWTDNCLTALADARLFESSGHRTRLKELLDCYADYPFFTKGLCKCMYLSAWDEEHFYIMLETLTNMSLGKETNTEDMRIQGDILAEEQKNGEYYVYQLSNAFLDNVPFRLDPNVSLEPGFAYIIRQALKAADIIDSV